MKKKATAKKPAMGKMAGTAKMKSKPAYKKGGTKMC